MSAKKTSMGACRNNLSNWHTTWLAGSAHPENRVAEQLAMAPAMDKDSELIRGGHGYAIGPPCTLDLDSIS